MNKTTSNINSNYLNEVSKQKSRNRLVKSSSTTTNNYIVYDKYYSKISLYKNKSRNPENNFKKSNSSTSKFNSKLIKSQNSFNIEGENKLNNNNSTAFSKIMEHYFQQKNKEILKRKQNVPLRKNITKNNNKIILEINSNNSNFYFKKNITTNNIKNSNSNKLTKRKIEDKKDNPDFKKDNKIKTTRNRNLSMKDIENISNNSKNLNCTNSNKSKVIKENIIVKKIYQSDNKNNNKKINKINYPTSPSITDRNKISNKKSNNTSKKLNTLKKSDSNIIEIIEKKYNILFNNNLNENINTNNKIISSRNSIKGNYISIKNDNEFTKTNNLNSKNVKKIDELEGPENIHFSLVELIQKGRKKMEEIVDKLNNNNK
jgi:hypothetical protein